MLNSLALVDSMGPFLAMTNTPEKNNNKTSWHESFTLKKVQVRLSWLSNSASWQRGLEASDSWPDYHKKKIKK